MGRIADDELQQIIYTLSHDLQEPARGISAYIDLARRTEGDEHEIYLEKASAQARRLEEFVRQILAYSRIITHGAEFKCLSLSRLLDNVVGDLMGLVRSRKGTVKYGLMPSVMGDEVQLGRMFQNLIENGLKYGGRRPRVVVEHEKGSIFVCNTGPGISQNVIDGIWDMGRRLVSHEQEPGSGMGLAIVKRIAERHGATINVTSGGNSTCFAIKGLEQCEL